MAKEKGILLTDDFDLQLERVLDGDGKIMSGMRLGNVLYQNQALILLCHPGEVKEAPILGCGIEDFTLDNNVLAWRRKIRMALELDGQQVREVRITADNQIKIDAGYGGA